jgi:DNA-binding transcriptional MerR regulator
MAGIADTLTLVDSIVRLRRAERIRLAAPDVAPARRQLEAQLGPTLSRSRASRVLGVSQTALDRWASGGQMPVVIAPSGRREVPRQVVLELRESLDRLREKGVTRHPLSIALAERNNADRSPRQVVPEAQSQRLPTGHDTAERRSLAYHQAVAERLNDDLIAEARDRVDRLSAGDHMHPDYAQRWREILALPMDRLAMAITADDQATRDLRQSSPFAGALNEYERRQIIDAVR